MATMFGYKEAILVMFLYLVNSFYSFSAAAAASGTKLKWSNSLIQFLLQLSSPIIGWIADAWLGRSRLLIFSVLLALLGCIVESVGLVLSTEGYLHQSVILQLCASVLNNLHSSVYVVTILPLITDHMIGASGDELSAAIDWWLWVNAIIYGSVLLIQCLLDGLVVTVVLIVLYSFSIAISLTFLIIFRESIKIQQQMGNPITDICSVLNYARKHRHPANRSAFTYWEANVPSRIDLGKEKYGGPFSEETVENVKTFFRLIPLTMMILVIALYRNDSITKYLANHIYAKGTIFWTQSNCLPCRRWIHLLNHYIRSVCSH